MKFRKYEFTPTQWTTLKTKIWTEEIGYNECHVVELGFLPTTPATYDSEGNVLTKVNTSLFSSLAFFQTSNSSKF